MDILNYEMEDRALSKMAGVYGFATRYVYRVMSDSTNEETFNLFVKGTNKGGCLVLF